MDNLETLRLDPNGLAVTKELLKAAPGYNLSLSQDEIKAFCRHDMSGDKANKNLLLGKVEEPLCHNLLDQY
jgi:hypothetical protein